MTETHDDPQPPSSRFPWGLFIVGLLAGTGGHWLALAALHLLAHGEASGWLIPLAFVASLGLARIYHLLRQRNRWPRSWREAMPQLALAWGVFVAALWFAVISETFLMKWLAELGVGDASVLLVFVGLALLGLSLPVYEELLDKNRHVRDLTQQQLQPADTPDAMILFLSTPGIVPAIRDSADTMHALVAFTDEHVANLHGKSLRDDIDATSAASSASGGLRWNWQQLLRALEPHPSLKQLWIIGSRDADNYENPPDLSNFSPSDWPAGLKINPNLGKGSADFAELCRRLLQTYTNAEIHVCDRAVRFEKYEDTMGVALEVLKRLRDEMPAHKIMVDVTGGTKITSIVGAALTLNRGTAFQYVDTQAPHAVIPFLLATEDAPGTHGH